MSVLTNELWRNIEGWMCYHTKCGDYKSWDAYIPSNNEWTKEEEFNIVSFLLDKLSESLNTLIYDTFDSVHFIFSFEDTNIIPTNTRFFQCIHMCATTKLLDSFNVGYTLSELEDSEFMCLICSAVPAPSIIYVGQVRNSTYKLSFQLLHILSVASHLIQKVNQFGLLGQLALKITIEYLDELLPLQTERTKDRFQKRISDCKIEGSKCLSVEHIIENLDCVDKHIYESLKYINAIKKLNIKYLSC